MIWKSSKEDRMSSKEKIRQKRQIAHLNQRKARQITPRKSNRILNLKTIKSNQILDSMIHSGSWIWPMLNTGTPSQLSSTLTSHTYKSAKRNSMVSSSIIFPDLSKSWNRALTKTNSTNKPTWKSMLPVNLVKFSSDATSPKICSSPECTKRMPPSLTSLSAHSTSWSVHSPRTDHLSVPLASQLAPMATSVQPPSANSS